MRAWRTSLGALPVQFLNAREKELGSDQPLSTFGALYALTYARLLRTMKQVSMKNVIRLVVVGSLIAITANIRMMVS